MQIRPFTSADQSGLASLYRRAFPDEDLMPVVTALHHGEDRILSLVAEEENAVVGHVLFSLAHVAQSVVALLAPLCVLPSHHRNGIGTNLVRSGFAHLTEEGVEAVFVLGDPAYYTRFGFATEHAVTPPYSLPEVWQQGWQSRSLGSARAKLAGPLHLPKPWLDPTLWQP